jgi:hypothetical protein
MDVWTEWMGRRLWSSLITFLSQPPSSIGQFGQFGKQSKTVKNQLTIGENCTSFGTSTRRTKKFRLKKLWAESGQEGLRPMPFCQCQEGGRGGKGRFKSASAGTREISFHFSSLFAATAFFTFLWLPLLVIKPVLNKKKFLLLSDFLLLMF